MTGPGKYPVMGDPVGAFVPHSLPPMAGSGQGPLVGHTFAVKDLYDIAGYATGGGSPDWLRTHEPATQTSGAVQRLLDAGADMVGKTVCDELFYSFTGANAHYGTPVNVRAPEHLPGGSSSGSAAATAAGLCEFALGSDTGGSVRLPASFCGLYGLRPTHGRVDLSHAMAMAPSFDAAGWFADDAELFRKVGPVLLDDAGVPNRIERLLIADDTFVWAEDSVSAPLGRFIDRAEPDLPSMENVKAVPHGFDESRECFRILQAAEVWRTFGAWVEATKPTFGPGIKARFEAAARITAAEVAEAAALQRRIREGLDALLMPGTVLCLPTAASLPPTTDPNGPEMDNFRARTMALICLASLSGLPQIAIPAAENGGCPVGNSFIGWRGGDEALLDLAVRLAPHCVAWKDICLVAPVSGPAQETGDPPR